MSQGGADSRRRPIPEAVEVRSTHFLCWLTPGIFTTHFPRLTEGIACVAAPVELRAFTGGLSR